MKKQLLIVSAMAMMAGGVSAQQLRGPMSEGDTRECYITWPQSYSLDQYINDWNPGQEMNKTYITDRLSSTSAWEDEEFFISRVKLRPLISNVNTQVDQTIVGGKDKNLLFWVPCGMSTGQFQTGSLPNGVFDSEVFSAWSYVTHYGNWTSPYGWVPGGFADAAHKHGVLVTGVASIPNSSMPASWRSCLLGMNTLASTEAGMEKIGKFLRYHGSDGLGYNSEWTGNWSATEQTALSAMHGKLVKYMKQYQDRVENPWYGGANDNGSVSSWGEGLGTRFYNTFGYSTEPRTIFFTNYNWNNTAYYSEDKAAMTATGRDSHDLYMGMNMQGGLKSSSEWTSHASGEASTYSIGLWGAHDKNMLFPARANYGGSGILKQQGYQKILEQWFTNGKRNPAARMEVTTSTSLSPNDNFMGMSRIMNARSAYGWDLSEEPFITYFSLGNGMNYYRNGEVDYANEWYNLGMQDYTPTWRWWWSTKLLGKEDEIPANSMNAEYSWDDAWNGGSALKISGSTAAGEAQYLHLFKTAFTVKNNDIITIRYKILKGNADMNFVYSKVGTETTEQTPTKTAVHKTSDSFFFDEWRVVTLKVAQRGTNVLSAGDWAVLGLKFENAKDLEMLIGEISIKRGTSVQPEMPVLRRSKVLADVVTGFDAKLYWSMPNSKEAGEPVYNLDVKTSHFNLWAQVEAGEPQFMGTTTSWAGIMYKIANPEHKKRVRLGVEAVSLDHSTTSGISWSEYLDAPEHEVSEEVKINKSCIKPGEEFRIWFVDDLHSNATLSLYNAAGTKVASNNGASRELVTSLDGIGAYDLVANEGTAKETRYSCFAQISDFSVGSLPEIQSLTINGVDAEQAEVEFDMNTEIKAGYTGREADGSGSRALKLNYKTYGVPMNDLNIGGNKSFSVSFWVRMLEIPSAGNDESINFFGIEDRTGGWPRNNWGWAWSFLDEQGHITHMVKRGNSANSSEYAYFYPETTALSIGAWTHVTWVFDFDAQNALLMKLYLNGVYQAPSKSGMGKENATADNVIDGIPVRGPNREVLSAGEWMHILGGRGSDPAYPDAIIDDVIVWDGAVDETDIAKAMVGLDADNLPDNVKCFWNFENEPQDNVNENRLVNGKTFTVTHNGRYLSKGQITDAPFGVFNLELAEGEGSSIPVHITPEYEAGCPYVKGTGFQVVTKPTWSTRQATISNADGNDTEGEATVVYGAGGDKILTLNLKNSWGEDNMEYPAFYVSTAIDGVAADADSNLKAYTVNKVLFLEFAEDGDYEVSVYNMSGMLVGKDARSINAGEMMNITIGQTGVYVVSIVKDGKELRSIKVANK